MCILALLEIRTIYRDQTKRDNEQADERRILLEHFGAIANGIGNSIDASDKHFQKTMARIETILTAAEASVKNTAPSATLEFKSFSLSTHRTGATKIQPGSQADFNVYFTNSGNDDATHVQRAARVYVAKGDDRSDQLAIARDFDDRWHRNKHEDLGVVRPYYPGFFTFRTDPFREEELKAIRDRSKTLYFLIRFAWMDRTGKWIADECFSIQDPTENWEVGHSCFYNINHKYPATIGRSRERSVVNEVMPPNSRTL